jgi:glycerol-3-phosphate acyltransferase PlsY
MKAALLIIGGYLLGSIPTAYLTGRWVKGIDLRQYGSGTVSGSMVWEHVARWAIFPAGIFDVIKGALPTWLGLELGIGEVLATTAGMAAVVGHNWPIYLGFTGGRGLSPFMGVLLGLFPWGFPWMLAFLAVGFLLGDSAPWALASLISLPLPAYWANQIVPVSFAASVMLIVTLVKRLEANGRPLPTNDIKRRQVLLRRLIFDRDITSHEEWINRQP